MRTLLLVLTLFAGCTNVEDDILPPDSAVSDGPRDAPVDGSRDASVDGPRDAPIDVHSIEEPPCLGQPWPCDAGSADAGVD